MQKFHCWICYNTEPQKTKLIPQLEIKKMIFSVCAPPPRKLYLPVIDHQSMHSKSLYKNLALTAKAEVCARNCPDQTISSERLTILRSKLQDNFERASALECKSEADSRALDSDHNCFKHI